MHSIWYLILHDRVLINFDVPQYIVVISPLSRLVKPTLLDRLQAYPRYHLQKKADTPRRATPDTNSCQRLLSYIGKNMNFKRIFTPSFRYVLGVSHFEVGWSYWSQMQSVFERKPDRLQSPSVIVWTSLISVAIWNAKRSDQLWSPTIIVRVYELVWSQL